MHEIAIQNSLWRISSRESSRFLPVGCVPRSLTRTKSTLQYNVHLLWAKKKKRRRKKERDLRERGWLNTFSQISDLSSETIFLGLFYCIPAPRSLPFQYTPHCLARFLSLDRYCTFSKTWTWIFVLQIFVYDFLTVITIVKKKKKEFALKYSTIFNFPLTLSNFFFGFFNRKAQYVYYRYN